MRFWTKGLTAVLAIMVSGCAWMQRDQTIRLKCPALEHHMQEIRFDLRPDQPMAYVVVPMEAPQNQVMGEGNTETGTATSAATTTGDPDMLSHAMSEALSRWRDHRIANVNEGDQPPLPGVLLLSGGGQWGAFGAGFLRSLSRNNDPAIRNSAIVTGISTGAIQTLFVLADDYDGLHRAYTAHEAQDYARVYSDPQTFFNGSRYSIRPLLGLLKARLLGTDGEPSLLGVIARRLNDSSHGARGPRKAFVGMVNARTGNFVQVDLSELIREIVPVGEQPSEDDADCVAAVVLASSAIPVNFERVSITYGPDGSKRSDVFYDGGVRQSVFFNHVTSSRSVAMMTEATEPSLPDSLPFYVLRNGPSTVLEQDSINNKHDILSAAFRGYAIIVNQSEVMAVCSLRLGNPSGEIKVQTADDSRTEPGLEEGAPPGPPFNATFMDGLAALGERVGNDEYGPHWRSLQPIHEGQQGRACVLQ